MKIKTSNLEHDALDWAVAKCEGKENDFIQWRQAYPSLTAGPSNNWSQGGPIIERERIDIEFVENENKCAASILIQNHIYLFYHSDPLIAAMRCYVASKLGDEVEVPEELICK